MHIARCRLLVEGLARAGVLEDDIVPAIRACPLERVCVSDLLHHRVRRIKREDVRPIPVREEQLNRRAERKRPLVVRRTVNYGEGQALVHPSEDAGVAQLLVVEAGIAEHGAAVDPRERPVLRVDRENDTRHVEEEEVRAAIDRMHVALARVLEPHQLSRTEVRRAEKLDVVFAQHLHGVVDCVGGDLRRLRPEVAGRFLLAILIRIPSEIALVLAVVHEAVQAVVLQAVEDKDRRDAGFLEFGEFPLDARAQREGDGTERSRKRLLREHPRLEPVKAIDADARVLQHGEAVPPRQVALLQVDFEPTDDHFRVDVRAHSHTQPLITGTAAPHVLCVD
eukprot:Opistho-1_new@41471